MSIESVNATNDPVKQWKDEDIESENGSGSDGDYTADRPLKPWQKLLFSLISGYVILN
jgi:hypothetical protein